MWSEPWAWWYAPFKSKVLIPMGANNKLMTYLICVMWVHYIGLGFNWVKGHVALHGFRGFLIIIKGGKGLIILIIWGQCVIS